MIATEMAGRWNTHWTVVVFADVGHTCTDCNGVDCQWVECAGWNAQALIAMVMG